MMASVLGLKFAHTCQPFVVILCVGEEALPLGIINNLLTRELSDELFTVHFTHGAHLGPLIKFDLNLCNLGLRISNEFSVFSLLGGELRIKL